MLINCYSIEIYKLEFVEILIGHIVVLDLPGGFHDSFVSNQLRVPSKTKPRIVAGFKTSCNGLDIFLEFQAPREAVHPESLNLCHSYVWEFR